MTRSEQLMLTEEQKLDLINDDICPYCKKTFLNWGSVEIENRFAIQPGTCYACNKTFRVFYKQSHFYEVK